MLWLSSRRPELAPHAENRVVQRGRDRMRLASAAGEEPSLGCGSLLQLEISRLVGEEWVCVHA